MSSSLALKINLSIEKTSTDNITLITTFENVSNDSYFLDKKAAFIDGKYSLSCLVLLQNGEKIQRKMHLKLRPSSYPKDYIEIKSKQKLVQPLVLNQIFHLPDEGEISIEYDCRNLNHVTGEKESIKSDVVTWDFSN